MDNFAHKMQPGSIARRLGYSFLGLAGLFIIVSLITLAGYKKIQSNQNALFNEALPSIMAAKNLSEKAAILTILSNDLSEVSTKQAFEQIKQSIEKQQQTIEVIFPKVNAPNIQAYYQEIPPLITDKKFIVSTILEQQKQFDTVIELILTEIAGLQRLFRSKILDLKNSDNDAAEHMNVIQASLLQLKQNMLRLIQTSNLTDVSTINNQTLLEFKSISQDILMFPQLTKAAAQNLKKLFEYTAKQQNVFEIQQNIIELQQRLKQSNIEMLERTQQLSLLTNQFVDKMEGNFKKERLKAEQYLTKVRYILVITTAVVGILTYLLLRLYIFTKIVARLKKLEMATLQMASGDLSQPIQATGNDEVTAMSRAIENFRQDLLKKRAAEQELQLIFDHVPVAIWYKDDKNNIIRLNNSAARSMGGRVNDFEGKSTYDLFPEQAKKYHLGDLEVINSGKPKFNIIEEYAPKNRPHGWVSTNKVPYTGKDNSNGLLVVSQDITVLKQAEAELEEAVKSLKSSNEELERFAYVASHDLQEPLRMVISFTELLESRYGDQLDETAKKYIDFASTAAKRMRELISDLLEYARIDSNTKQNEWIDMNDMVEYTREILTHAITESKAVIHYEALPTIWAHKLQISQLLQNLLANSIKYRAEGRAPEIFISYTEAETHWHFAIQDNGIGINPDYADKIFQPFQRLHAKESFSGTGIGLAICRKIVESFNGKIWVEAISGKQGSIFHFTIGKI